MIDTKQPEALLQAARLRNVCAIVRSKSYPLSDLIPLMQEAADTLERTGSENAALQQDYDAARLEIEALQARIKAMAEERADELAVAHLDGRMRAGQPAPVMFNGLTEEETMNTASYAGLTTKLAGEYPPLPEPYHVAYDDIDKEDVKCFAEGQLHAYVDADRAMRAQAAPAAVVTDPCPGCMPGRYCRKLSCGRLIALNDAKKATPAAVAGPSDARIIAAFRAYHGRPNEPLIDGAEAARWKRALIAALAAAPTTQAAPVAQGDAEDAARYRWLRDFHADEIHDEFPYVAAGENYKGAWALYGDKLDAAIDAARAQAKEGTNHE